MDPYVAIVKSVTQGCEPRQRRLDVMKPGWPPAVTRWHETAHKSTPRSTPQNGRRPASYGP